MVHVNVCGEVYVVLSTLIELAKPEGFVVTVTETVPLTTVISWHVLVDVRHSFPVEPEPSL